MGYGNNNRNIILPYVGGNFEVRVAREKPYSVYTPYHPVRCYKCKQEVEPGEKYFKDIELDHGYRHTYCLECGEEILEMRVEASRLWNEEDEKESKEAQELMEGYRDGK